MTARITALFVLASTLLLSAAWALRAITTFDDVGEALVIAEMRYQATHHRFPPGGLLIVARGDTAYVSQSGAQGWIAGLIARRTVPAAQRLLDAPKVYNPDTWYEQVGALGMSVIALKAFAVLLTAATLSFFALFVAETWGLAGGAILVLILANSPALASYAASLFWVTPLLFAPFVVSWYAVSAVRAGRLRPGAYYALVAALIFLKSLAGYEFLSAILSAASLPVVYYALLDDAPLRVAARRVLAVGASGVGGFAVALAIHLSQLAALRGSLGAAIDAVRNRVDARMLGAAGSSRYPLHYLWELYPQQEVLALSAVRFRLWMLCALLPLVALLALRRAARVSAPRARAAWRAAGGALLYAMVCSVSWLALAPSHMAGNYHLGLIIFFIPAALMLFAMPALALDARRQEHQSP